MPDWASLCLALGLIAIVFGVLRLWQRRRPAIPAELMRKAAHVAVGAVAAAFPWLFQATWPGLVLCSVALLGMIAVRSIPAVRGTLGQVTGSVQRQSWGEVCFPLGIACVWVLSGRDPVLFVVPVLLLTLGDAAAALVGTGYGRHKFRTTEGQKSVEGSLAFLAVGFAATLAALSVLTPDLGVAKAMLVALLLGSLLMVFEAIAWRGLDNLLLPVLAFVLLRVYLTLDTSQLATRIAVFSGILALMVGMRKRRTLIGEGVLTAAIFLYGAWALGGWPWVVPPAAVVLAAPWLPRSPHVPNVAVHGVFPVIALSASGLCLLLVHTLTSVEAWPAFVATFAASLSIIACVQLHPHRHRLPSARLFAGALTLGVVLVVIPAVVAAGLPLSVAPSLLACAALSSSVACAVAFTPALDRIFGVRLMWLLRGVAVSLGTACAVLLNTVVPVL